MKRKVLLLEGNVDGTVGGSYYVMYDLALALDKDKYHPVVGFHRDNYLRQKLEENGIEVFVFHNPKSFSFGIRAFDVLLAPIKKAVNFFKKFLIPGLALAKYLRRNRIDLIHLNNSITRNHQWMLAAALTGTPCITQECGFNDHFTLPSRYFGKRLGAIICVSRAIRDNMIAQGVDYPNMQVIHPGIDPNRYHIRQSPEALRKEFGLDDGDPVIGVVGNIKLWKGQETIVRALPELVKSHPDLKCVLVGDSSPSDQHYKDMLVALSQDLNVEDNLIFTGFQNNAIDFMNLMDIVVHTSVDPEPFGIVTLEAMSLSKPLVSTTIGGPAEIVVHNSTGILVEPGRPELLADALNRLLSDPVSAETLGKKGHERLNTDFTFEKCLNRTMDQYERVLETFPKQAEQ